MNTSCVCINKYMGISAYCTEIFTYLFPEHCLTNAGFKKDATEQREA